MSDELLLSGADNTDALAQGDADGNDGSPASLAQDDRADITEEVSTVPGAEATSANATTRPSVSPSVTEQEALINVAILLEQGPEVQLQRLGFSQRAIQTIIAATDHYNNHITDRFYMYPAILGMLWRAEGFIGRVTIDASESSYLERFITILSHLDATRAPASYYESFYITTVGLFGFGLDSVFDLQDTDDWFTSMMPNQAHARWQARMASDGWTAAPLDFTGINFVVDAAPEAAYYRVDYPIDEIQPFLLAKCQRFLQYQELVPRLMAEAGFDIEGLPNYNELVYHDPILAYIGYNGFPTIAARFYLAVELLRQLLPAVLSDNNTQLAQAIWPWFALLNDKSDDGFAEVWLNLVPKASVTTESGSGKHRLLNIAELFLDQTRDNLDSETQRTLDGLLTNLRTEWLAYAQYVWPELKRRSTGDFLYWGTEYTDQSQLQMGVIITGRNSKDSGTRGYAIRNFGNRYTQATDQPHIAGIRWQLLNIPTNPV